jgi:hypothetical protein
MVVPSRRICLIEETVKVVADYPIELTYEPGLRMEAVLAFEGWDLFSRG